MNRRSACKTIVNSAVAVNYRAYGTSEAAYREKKRNPRIVLRNQPTKQRHFEGQTWISTRQYEIYTSKRQR